MDFQVPEELSMMVESVRRFREEELMPLEREFLLNGELPESTRLRLEERGRELGFWALDVPKKDGGQELGELAMCMIAEELYKHPMMFEFGGSPEPSLYMCNEEQKQRFYHSVIAGKRRCCYAFTEPDTGSDFARIRTVAVRDGNDWVINGRKTFISHVERADFLILFATTNPKLGGRGVTCFLVDKGTPGFGISKKIATMGDGWAPCELSFENCRVPDANRLGGLDQGWKIANHQLTHGRLRIAAYQLGIAKRCIDLAIEWAKARTTWGKPIGSRQAIQWMLVDSHVELEAARLLVYRAAALADGGKSSDSRTEAFVAKLYAAEMSGRVTDRCLQVFGGMGYTKEVPVQSFYRQARLWRIGHGTSEIHRWMIARDLLQLSASD